MFQNEVYIEIHAHTHTHTDRHCIRLLIIGDKFAARETIVGTFKFQWGTRLSATRYGAAPVFTSRVLSLSLALLPLCQRRRPARKTNLIMKTTTKCMHKICEMKYMYACMYMYIFILIRPDKSDKIMRQRHAASHSPPQQVVTPTLPFSLPSVRTCVSI